MKRYMIVVMIVVALQSFAFAEKDMKESGKEIGKGAKKAGVELKKTGKEVGKAFKVLEKDTGKAFKALGKGIKEGVKDR